MKRCDKVFNTGVVIVSTIIGCSLLVSSASALTYQDEVDLEFTLNPTISISVSDDLTVANLVPGNYGDSNIITVSSSSNAIAGYTVYSTVGSSTYTSNELKKDGADNTNKFTSISTNKATLSDFSDSNWGYAWCNGTCNSESTWVSGDAGSTTNGYNGLPLYTATGVKVVNSSTPGSSTVSFKIGARAASSQVAGTYNNVINFVAVANPNPEPPKTFDQAFADAGKTKSGNYYVIQDANTTICDEVAAGETTTLIDSRDDEEYLVGKLADGNCWMLDNLRLDLTDSTILNGLTTENTHVDSASLTGLKSGNRSAGDRYATAGVSNWTSSYSFSEPLVNAIDKDNTTTSYGAGSGKIGVYYNYCAASAGNYCFGSGASAGTPSGNAQYDICPKGWRMPTGGSSGEYNTLYITGYSSDATNFRNALSTPLSGYFLDGSAGYQGSYGYFWSSTYCASDVMYGLGVNSSNVLPTNSSYRRNGRSVRCIIGS